MKLSAIGASSTRLLRGRIRNLHKTRRTQDFFFTTSDRAKMGATAIAAGLAGLGGIATGLSGMAMDTTEEADLLEFDLDGKAVRAWVWQSVFDEGDEVEVVAEQSDGLWQGYGIFRVCDRIVALHPHCSKGRYAHYKLTFRLIVMSFCALYAVMWAIGVLMMLVRHDGDYRSFIEFMLVGGVAAFGVYGVIGYRVSRKFMGFVRLAEGIFSGFGWSNVRSIDLPAITKKNKEPGDPDALGVLYFRY